MSGSRQAPRNGLAKLLWEADRDDPPHEVAAEKDRFECPECSWTAELHRKECMVCEHDEPLRPLQPVERTDR